MGQAIRCRDTVLDVATRFGKIGVATRFLVSQHGLTSLESRPGLGMVGGLVSQHGLGVANGVRAVCAVRAHCAHDPSATVHCVVHCLGHCSWTLYTNTVMDTVKKKYKNGPWDLGHHSLVSELRNTNT